MLIVRDVSTNHILVGPVTRNAPFSNTDRSCYQGGIERLDSGHVLYLGESLSHSSLKGHTLQATIKLCTHENLYGTCVQKVIEFVVP